MDPEDPKDDVEIVEEAPSQLDKLKIHLRENQDVYILYGKCFLLGALTMAIFGKLGKSSAPTIQNIMSPSFYNLNGGTMPSGRLSKVVQNIRTKELHTSIISAALEAGVTREQMSAHLNGRSPSPINGDPYRIVGTMDTSIWN